MDVLWAILLLGSPLLGWILLVKYSQSLRSSNRSRRAVVLRDLPDSSTKKLIGFFHPYW